MNIDIHAAGTWIKMIRYASPCCASVGATPRPSHSPTIASNAAAAPNQRASRCATGKKDTGEAYLNQLIEVKCIAIQRNPNGRRAVQASAQRLLRPAATASGYPEAVPQAAPLPHCHRVRTAAPESAKPPPGARRWSASAPVFYPRSERGAGREK